MLAFTALYLKAWGLSKRAQLETSNTLLKNSDL